MKDLNLMISVFHLFWDACIHGLKVQPTPCTQLTPVDSPDIPDFSEKWR